MEPLHRLAIDVIHENEEGWVASQAVDLLYGGVVAETPASAALEDSLEAIGSTLFVLSALIFAQRISRDGAFLDGAATPRRREEADTAGREFRDTPA